MSYTAFSNSRCAFGLGEVCLPDPDDPEIEGQWYQGACRTDDEIAAMLGLLCTGSEVFEGTCNRPAEVEKLKTEKAKAAAAGKGGWVAPSSSEQAASTSEGPSVLAVLIVGAIGIGVIVYASRM